MNQQGFDASGGAGSLSKLFAHYDRTKLLNPETGEYEYQRYPSLTVRGSKRSVDYSEIDPTRTHLNYNLAADDQKLGQAEFFERRLGEIYVHKAALKNALVDWVVTLPDMEQYAGREREFFETVYGALCEKYGRENVISAYVHMDEVQPHMHFAFVPAARDEKHPQGWKLSRKAVNTCERTVKDKKTGREVVKRDTREFSKQAHEWLDQRVCKVMGFEHAGVVLTDEQRKKRTIKENLDGPAELKQAQERLTGLEQQTEQETQRLEGLQRRCEEVEPAAQTIPESIRTLWTARSDGAREEQLAGEVDGLRSRISELERANRAARERVPELERRRDVLAGRVEYLRGAVSRARDRFEQLAGMVRGAVCNVGERVATMLCTLGIEAYAGDRPVTPQMQARAAREAARGSVSLAGEAAAMRAAAKTQRPTGGRQERSRGR